MTQVDVQHLAKYALRIIVLERTLAEINSIIYCQGAPAGSPEYFEIRALCRAVLYPDERKDEWVPR